ENLPIGSRVGAIYEEAARMPAHGLELAVELWKLERLELPFEEPTLFKFPEAPEELKAFRARAAGVFESLFEQFGKARAKGQAGFRAATLLDQDEEWEKAVKLCKRVEKAAG